MEQPQPGKSPKQAVPRPPMPRTRAAGPEGQPIITQDNDPSLLASTGDTVTIPAELVDNLLVQKHGLGPKKPLPTAPKPAHSVGHETVMFRSGERDAGSTAIEDALAKAPSKIMPKPVASQRDPTPSRILPKPSGTAVMIMQIAKSFEKFYSMAQAGLPRYILLKLMRRPSNAHTLPKVITESPEYESALNDARRRIGDDYEKTIRLLNDFGFRANSLENAGKALEKLKAEQSELERKAQSLDTLAGTVTNENQSRQEQLDEMYAELNKQREAVRKRENDVSFLQLELKRTGDELAEKITAFQQEKNDLTEYYAQLETDFAHREEELDKQKAANEAIATSLRALQDNYGKKLEDLALREKELEKHKSELDLASDQVFRDREGIEADRALYQTQKTEFDKMRAAYETGRAALDAQRKELDERAKEQAERHETLAKGYKQLELAESAVADKDNDLARRHSELDETIEKRAQELARQKTLEVHALAEQLHQMANEYTAIMGANYATVLSMMQDLAGRAKDAADCYIKADDERQKKVNDLHDKLKALTNPNNK